MKDIVNSIWRESISVKERFFVRNESLVLEGAEKIATCLASGHKLLIFGNGGSAADAQHMAAEFVNRFRLERPPLAAMALTTDSSILTSIGNDYGFDEIFSKQVSALGRRHDMAIGISTSGSSPNVVKAMDTARAAGLFTMGLSGRQGRLPDLCDICYCIPSNTTARVQETHITLIHVLCDLVERILFP